MMHPARMVSVWWGKSLRRRLLVSNVVTTLIFVALLGYLSLRTGQIGVRQEVEQSNRRLATLAAKDVSAQYDAIINDARRLRQQLTVSSLTVQARGMLDLRLAAPLTYRALYLFEGDEQLLIHLTDRLENLLKIQDISEITNRPPISLSDAVLTAYEEASSGIEFLSPVQITGVDQVPIIFMGIPLGSRQGQPRQIVVVEIDLRSIWQRVDEINVGHTGRAFVVSQEGLIIAHPDRRYIGQPIASPLRSVLAGYEGQTQYTDPLGNGRVMLVAYSPVGIQSGWGIVIEQELDEALAPVNAIAYTTLEILLAAIAIATLIAALVAQSIIRPVQYLAEVTRTIAQTGSLTQRVEVKGRDEVGQLAAAFNEMLANLWKAEQEIHRLNEDLEQRVVQRTAELNAAKERVEAILNNSSDVIILAQTDGTLQQANAAFYRVFSHLPGTWGEQPLTALFEPAQTQCVIDILHTLVNTSQPQRMEAVACRRDGTVFDVDLALAPIQDEGKHVIGIVCSLRDITWRRELEQSLRQALDRERELNVLKSRVIETVSHEFRTPFAVVQSASDILAKYNDRMSDEQRRQKRDAIRNGIRRVTGLLDDVLIVSHSGLDRDSPIPLDLAQFCRALVREGEETIGKTDRVVFSSAGECTNMVMDPTLVRQIVRHLLHNAAKFSSPDSTIWFHLQCDTQQIMFRIQDQGIGIPKADQAHIFEVLHRAGNVGALPGAGLGLSIAKQAVELHGGTITFESEEGVGTTFTVIIPQVPSDKAHETNPGH